MSVKAKGQPGLHSKILLNKINKQMKTKMKTSPYYSTGAERYTSTKYIYFCFLYTIGS